jgi:hypothetical protein
VLRLRIALIVAVLLTGGVLILLRDGSPENVPVVPTPPGAGRGEAVDDPFAWTPERSDDLARRAAVGTSPVLFERSPGGAVATAARVNRFRRLVESAAKTAGVDPDLLEALVFLESAGRPDAQAPGGAESATGLTQILAETGQNLLGMKVDVERSAHYTRRLERRDSAAVRRARARVDERFDPAKALAATARYLALAKEKFGRDDLAFVSYHMGMGNLDDVIEAYGGGPRSYAELYFASTPTTHTASYELLASFGDDSSNYFWKLGAAREIMRKWRENPASVVPPGVKPLPAGGERTLPNSPADTGIRAAPGVRLRPEAVGVALYIGAKVRPPLRVTRGEGATFRVSRSYESDHQALAFQYVLDRLRVLNVITWERNERSISLTALEDAAVLEPLLDRLG